jgi:hypothetical protein
MPDADRRRLEEWAHIAEIVAAAGVVVSVLYLGFQIGDNTKLLRSEAHYNALMILDRTVQLRIENADLNRVLTLCLAGSAEVTPLERERCRGHTLMVFNGWEYLYYQNEDGSVPEQLWMGADAYCKQLIRTSPGLGWIWRDIAPAYADPFRSYVEMEFARRQAPGD